MDDEDLPLVRALQAGDDSALDELMSRHKAALFGFIYRYVRNEVEAAELTQETFVRVYFNIRSFTPKARFVTWLFAIATNLCRDHLRSRHHRDANRTFSLDSSGRDKPVELLARDPTPFELAECDEQVKAVEVAIGRLPHDLKTALTLTALEGLSHIEAAQRLGTTPKTIETRVYRARKRLEKMLRVKRQDRTEKCEGFQRRRR
ncbi:MAG TPA: sigma-70 family RNA polymerase sigma factor [Chthoniobacterales bacterium]